MKDKLRNFALAAWPDVLVVLAFLAIAFVYFFTPLSEELVLGGHDTVAGLGQGQEQTLWRQATGEITRWTNSIFCGMPTYQISPSYGPMTAAGWLASLFGLFTTGPMNYLFVYLFGFYILMRVMRVRALPSAFGAVAWAFSSYFFIIIAAGHIWKVNTLGLIPPTIAGLILAYRGKYLWGLVVMAVFTALQVRANHLQMTYYFLFVMALIAIAYGVEAVREGKLGQWLKATGVVIVGGLLGAAVNLPNLYHTWSYTKESMRGGTELVQAAPADSTEAAAAAQKTSNGLDRDYITQWSYGIDETWTLLIADFKGGGSGSALMNDRMKDNPNYNEFLQQAQAAYQDSGQKLQYLPGVSTYWGDQPFTVGPVYVGAIICLLFVLGLFVVRGPLKWALAAATVVSFVFAWGKHIMPVTDALIDWLPLYSKFRTVSSALVIAEFTMPMLATLGLVEVLRNPSDLLTTRRGQLGTGAAALFTVGACLLFALVPGASHLVSQTDAEAFDQLALSGFGDATAYRSALEALHGSILSASAWRSFWLSLAALVIIVVYAKWPKTFHPAVVVALLLMMVIGDLWNIDQRYLNDQCFQPETARTAGFTKNAADERILQDTTYYRVLNLSGGNPFNEDDNHTAYLHHSIGGYHAAKLHRFQELIDRYLYRPGDQDNPGEVADLLYSITNAYDLVSDDLAADADPDAVTARIAGLSNIGETAPILCMLNAKWLSLGGGRLAMCNPDAMGNGWMVSAVEYAQNANEELDALGQLDLHTAAVADAKFKDILGETAAPAHKAQNTGIAAPDSVLEDEPADDAEAGAEAAAKSFSVTSYAPNELHYTIEATADAPIAVFSEVYYPGWTATVDGKPADIARVNYILRALRLEPGRHDVVFTFKPKSVTVTETVGYVALAAILLLLIFAIFRTVRSTND